MEWLFIILGVILVIGIGLAIYEWRKGIKMRYDHSLDSPDKMEADRMSAKQSSKDGF